MKKILLHTALFLLIISCKKEDPEPNAEPAPDPAPVACIQEINDFQPLLQPVNFRSCSQNTERVEWNFGDGGSATISDPSHVFVLPGLFTVALKAIKGTRSSDASKKIIAANKITLTCEVACTFAVWNMDEYATMDVYSVRNNDNPVFISSISGQYQQTEAYIDSISVSDPHANYRFKLVFKRINGIGQQTLEKDSVMTSEINCFSGTAIPVTTKSTSFIKADQNSKVHFKS